MRVAITGVGAITPLGLTALELADGLRGDRIGIRPAPWAPEGGALFAGVDERFDATGWFEERRLDGVDPFACFAVAACDEALVQAGRWDDGGAVLDDERTAVVAGTSMGGMYSLMLAQARLEQGGSDAVPPKTMLRVWSNMAAAQLCVRYRVHGPSLTVTTACASSIDAIGQAARMVASGAADTALAGGAEGGWPAGRPGIEDFRPVTSVAGRILGMESPAADPARAVLPFDVDRSGIVFGEGAVFVVLESEASVRNRGAEPLAWLRGYGSCADSYHPSSPDPSGRWEARAMELALAEAGADPSEVGAVVAHATGTPKGDAAELKALDLAFGREDLLVTSVKGHTGHTGASAGAVGVVTAVEALRTGVLSHTAGTTTVDPDAHVDVVVGEPRRADLGTVQVNAFGFGGQNASVVLSRA
ncbi:MAG: beta-ketoacyl-[acyl-carrier-protein] synthase family protein [Actinomycetota bacterium]